MIRYPDGNVLLRNLSRDYPVVSHGEGVYLFDTAGKRWIDGSSGALVCSVGHGNKEVAARIGEQLSKVAYVNGMQFTSGVTEEAATRLAKLAPKGLSRSAFLGSGSEAIEAAIKFARQLWVERGQPQRSKIIARTPGYHGNTLYALSASGRPHYKKWFGPLLSDVVTTEAPYGYRAPCDYEKDGAAYYAKKLEESIAQAGANEVAAFLFETVVGSSAGAAVPPPGYYDAIAAVCRKHGILMIADEVMCGAGRTGRFFALEHFGLQPDIVVMGKGVSGGYVPASVVMVQESAVAELKAGSGSFMHAQTYLQAPAMTASIVATLEYFEKHNVVGNAAMVGLHMQTQLRKRLLGLPYVGNVSGIGMLAGVEFVADKSSKAAFPRSKKKVEALVQACFDDGLILWPNTGQANGTDGDLVMVGPPLVATVAQIDELIDILERNILRLSA